MEKKVIIGGKEVRLVSSGATPIFYKNAFKADFFEDFGEIMEIADTASKAKKGQEMKALLPMFKSGQIAKLYNFMWVYAKNADQSIKPLDEWIESFDEFPLFDFLQELMDLMMSSITTKKG
ncbi:hypothetical protein WOSG25_220070 [Weissella oryzae SG25]|uniref:Prophage protein n=1 Tax=Weissella oryzae (strain DSM 25784 / JCM 18191 / LMG 30913 / SG25) TaxID=1329250 RepID=A0A069CWX4_WEIOS|nr:hypothetical protein [Weissella oryzae]GAK31979.1 hypothetical protein WOSG25_220070 [Weissella oryzae SG25]